MIFQSSRPCWVFAIDFRKFAGIAAAACLVFFATSCALWDASSGEERRDAGDVISADADISTNDTFEDDASDADSTPDIIDASDAETPDADQDADIPDTVQDADTPDADTVTPGTTTVVIEQLTVSGFSVELNVSVTGDDVSKVEINWGNEINEDINSGFANISATHTYSALGDFNITVIAHDQDGALTSASTTVSFSVPTTGLAAAYLFDGNLEDSWGNEADAISLSSADMMATDNCVHFTSDRHGILHQAVELNDGYENANCEFEGVGYLSIPPFELSTSFTISMWVLTQKADGVFLFQNEGITNATNWLRFFVGNDPKSHFYQERVEGFGMNGTSGIFVNGDSTPPMLMQNDIWYHYALWASTVDNTTEIRLYRDGVLLNNTTGTAIPGFSSASDRFWLVGNTTSNDESSFAMKGKVDDIRFYTRALNENEIKKLAAE